MPNFIPDHGQWVVFRCKLPDGVEAFLDLKRKAGPAADTEEHIRDHADHTSPPHKSGDGFHVGIYFAPKRGPIVNGVETAPPPPRIWLVNVLGCNVPGVHFDKAGLPNWQRNVTFALSEVSDLQAADTDDLPPGRHPSAPSRNETGIPPATMVNRPKRKRA